MSTHEEQTPPSAYHDASAAPMAMLTQRENEESHVTRDLRTSSNQAGGPRQGSASSPSGPVKSFHAWPTRPTLPRCLQLQPDQPWAPRRLGSG